MAKKHDSRRFYRTRLYRGQTLSLRVESGPLSGDSWAVSIRDFSEGGLSFESKNGLEEGVIVALSGELRAEAAAMAIDARSRVIHCAPSEASYRIGVTFLEVSYRRLSPNPEE